MRSVHKVLLVSSGTDDHVSSIANDGTFPAQVTPMEQVLSLVYSFSPDLVEVSALSTSYRSLTKGKDAGEYVLVALVEAIRNGDDPHRWDRHLKNGLDRYGRLHADEDITGVTTMNRARGCAWASRPRRL